MSKKTVFLIGDSIRMGYQAVVREELVELAFTRSPAENCMDTGHIVAHLEGWLEGLRPDVIHLNSGLHDIKRFPEMEGPKVTLADYAANLEAIFARLRALTGATLIFATTTPVVEAKHQALKPFRRLNADIAAYNERARDLATAHGVLLNDLHALLPAPEPLLVDDGVHFTRRGYELLGQVVAAAICQQL